MIKNGTLKLNYIGSSSIINFKFLSTQTTNVGKNISVHLNDENPKPIIIPPEPMPSIPIPTLPYPSQTPSIEIPGPIVEPSLPQSIPQTEPTPESKPPIEIPVRNKSTIAHQNVQMNNEDDILIKDVENRGVVTLNRTKALNALNSSMIEKIYNVLKKWETSKKLVIVEGAGEKAFCAGGDVKSIVIALKENNNKLGETFFRKEYILNHLIATYKIPYVTLINGVTMGGGVGISVHGKYRVATEKTLFAMPETAIGLFPDVGGTYFLPRLKGKLGLYLGLTGERLKGIDVLLAGIATHFVPFEKLADLKQDLLITEPSDITKILNKYQPQNLSNQFSLTPYLNQIDKCFSASSVEEIIDRLKEDKSEWAEKTIQALLKMSPSALKVTMKAIQKGDSLTLTNCLKMEYRLMCNYGLRKNGDFSEGVRALLIDKDQNPKWNPKNLSEISDTYVNQQFIELPQENELPI